MGEKGSKACKKCGETKPLNEFNQLSRSRDGREGTCKICRKASRMRHHFSTCVLCGKEFNSDRKSTRYCGKECSDKAQENKIEVNCGYCDKDLRVPMYEFINNKKNYCSVVCKNADFRIRFKGENNPCYRSFEYECDGCGESFTLRPHAYERSKKKYCTSECYRSNIGGENNPYWNPDITDEEREVSRKYPEYSEWRLKVFERDSYTCKACSDDTGGNLVAHHVLNYSEHRELRTEISNGLTLCECCHRDFHGIYGYRNNTENQMNEYLLNKTDKRRRYCYANHEQSRTGNLRNEQRLTHVTVT